MTANVASHATRRTVAVVRTGKHAADDGVAQKRERDRRGQFADRGGQFLAPGEPDDDRQQRHGQQRQRILQRIDAGERDFALLLARRAHGRHELRRIALNDAVGVPDNVEYAFVVGGGDLVEEGKGLIKHRRLSVHATGA